MGNNLNNNNLFQKVKELNLPAGKYALFGSAPIGIREIRKCRDIDIIVTEDLWDEYKNKNWKVKVMPYGSQYLFNDKIELWKDWKPGEWDERKLIKEAEIIDGLPFVKLKEVIRWKKIKGRKKDLKDVEMIEKFLRTRK